MLDVQVNPCHFQVVRCIGSVLSVVYLVLGLAFISHKNPNWLGNIVLAFETLATFFILGLESLFLLSNYRDMFLKDGEKLFK